MAALTGTNGVLTIANTTDTFTKPSGSGQTFQPQAALFNASAAGHLILTDADGVTVLELYAGASASVALDAHFFVGMRPWKTPIKAGTLTGGGSIRLYM
jgi:hypothetical protein